MTEQKPALGSVLRSALIGCLAIAAGGILSGCDFPARPPIAAPPSSSIPQDVQAETTETAGLEPPQISFSQDWEAWDAYFLNNQQVGYSHIVAEKGSSGASGNVDPNVQYTVEDQIRLRSGKARYVQHLRQRSTETSTGALLDFEATLYIGPIVKQFIGTVEAGNLRIETVQGSSRSSESIPWQSSYRGLASIQQSLHRKPMKPGERRLLKGLSPIRYQISTVSLHCHGPAAIPMIDGSFQTANEIVARFRNGDDPAVEQLIWINDEGDMLKTLRPADGLTSYRTDESTATAGATAVDDLLGATAIALSETLERPGETTRVTYRVRPSAAAIGQPLPIDISAQPGQWVRDLADGSFELVVTRRDESPPAGFRQTTLLPDQGDTAPGKLIDFQSRQIVKLAATAGRGSPPNERALALELTKLTNALMDRRNARGFVKASEIVSTMDGNAIEHAILLAAFLRARELPARLAVGLVYQSDDQPRMSLHVWNLAYVDGQWISLDAISGTAAPADRIILTTTDLSDGQETAALRPVMEALGRIEIVVRDAEH